MSRLFPPKAKLVLDSRHAILLGTFVLTLLATVIPPPMLALVVPAVQRFLPVPAIAYAQSPTLELTKGTSTTTIESGTPFEYTLTYKCASITTNCADVTITDILPADLEYVPGTALPTSHIQSINHATGTLTWTFVNPLPAGSTGVLRFSAQFKPGTLPGTSAQNEADMTASNVALAVVAQSTVVTAIGAFEMFADKSGPSDAVIGFPADFSVGICSPDSSGGIRLTNPVITDTLPAEAFFVDAQGIDGVDWTYTPAIAPDQGGEVVFTNLPTVEVGGCLSRKVTLRYESDPGVLQTNAMAASGTPEGEAIPVLLTDTYDFGVIAPYADGQFGKSSTSPSKFSGAAAKPYTEVLAGEAVTYTVSLANTGYLTLTNAVITDVLPSQLDLTAWQVSATITKPVSGFYQINGDGNWLPLPGNPYSADSLISVASLGLGGSDVVTHLRWDLSPMDVLPIYTPAYSAWVSGTTNASLALGTLFDNCGYAKITELTGTLTACDTVEIIAQRAIPRMGKSNGSGPFLPLATVDFALDVSNADVAHLNFDDPVIADLLVPELTFLTGTVAFDNSAAPGAPVPNFTAISNYNGTGRTLLRWAWDDQSGSGGSDARYSLAPGERLIATFQAQVVDGTPPGAYTNEAALIDWAAPGDPNDPGTEPEKLLLCAANAGIVYTDTFDLDGDSQTDEVSCLAGSTVKVPVALSMNSEKFVRGTMDCENTTDYGATTACEDEDYNKLGLTVLGGDVDYRLIMTNTSNVSVTKITLIDIFPHIGDTGVIDPQARQSVWGPNLQTPVTAPGGIPLTIYYSTQTNPCRTELVAGGPSGCSPANWTTTFPADPTSVHAIKIEFCDIGNPDDCVILPRNVSLAFDWHMVAPNVAPADASCLTPADDSFDWQGTPACSIAWNSFGFTAFEAKDVDTNNVNDPDALQLPPTEPIRVGMRIAPDDKYSLGDYVWLDVAGLQDDGIQQAEEIPDWGLSGVRIELYDSVNNFIDYRYTGPDQNGDPGYYQFSYLGAGDYYLRFFPPAGYTVSPQQQGAGGHDTDDSDGVTQGTDPTYGDYYQTETFTVDAGTTDANRFTPAWDFGLWPPVDYGDADSLYPVAAIFSSPEALAGRHIIVPNFYLGSGVDSETDGQADPDALGDDLNGDDEDGVTFPDYISTAAQPTGVLFVGRTAALTITGTKPVTPTGNLNAWIDWNGNGTWDAGDQVATDVALDGTISLNVTIPATATLGTTYARFRYGSESGMAPTGIAIDGEVEDYKVVILTPPIKTIYTTSAPHTTGTEVTIGEVVRYRLQTALPEGTLSNFQITDLLPNGLQYSDTITVAVIADTSIISGGLTVTPGAFVDGTDPVFNFGTVTNNDNDSDEEFLIVEFDAVVLNVNNNQSGQYRDNSFNVTFESVDETSDSVQVSIVEPVVNLNKQLVTPLPAPLNPGTVITYQVTITNQSGINRSDAMDLIFTDTLPAGLTNPVVVSITPDGSPVIATPSSEVIGNHIRIPATVDGSFDLPIGATVTILYHAQLAPSVEPGDIVTNKAGLIWSTLDGNDPNERDGGGDPDGNQLFGSGALNDYERAVNDSFTVTGDWGDAPNSYATTLSNATVFAGPAHFITSTLYLGALVDDEIDGQPVTAPSAADGDDNAGSPDDEDGITFLNPIVPRRVISTVVTVHNTSGSQAYLNGWLDFDGDGTFTQGADQIFDGVAVNDGVQTLTFTVPETATQNIPTYARFRLSTDANTDFYGLALLGEVEDYETYIEPLGYIGDRIWYDLDLGGDDDGSGAGEFGIPNIEVQLVGDGKVVTTTTTITGYYVFTDLPPGTYGVTVITSTLPLTIVHTPTADPDGGADSISSVTLTRALFQRPDQDFGYPPELHAIGNQVWLDFGAGAGFANNSRRDGGESGINGVLVELYDAANPPGSGSAIDSMTTTNGGFYLFDNLLDGDYIVHIPASNFSGVLDGYVSSTGGNGDVATDDNLDENGQDTLVNGGVSSTAITLFPHTEPTGEAGANGTPASTQVDDNTNLTIDFGFTIETFVGCSVGNDDLGGTLFRDYNANGRQDANEPGFVGVPGPVIVSAYDDAGALLGQTLVQDDGSYVLPGIFGTATDVRLEFGDLPDWLQSGPAGTSSSTTVQFHAAASCSADLGVNNPSHYCQNNPDMASTCFSFGDGSSGLDTVVVFPYNSGTTSQSSNATVAFPEPAHVAINTETGGIWGLAWSNAARQLFAAASMRRHVGFGPLGPGGIYMIDPNTQVTTSFLDLNALQPGSAGPDYHDTADFLNDGPDTIAHPVWDAVGKTGFGDLDAGEDGKTLWVSALYERALYRIELNTADPVTFTNITKYALPDPGTTPGVGCPYNAAYTPPSGIGYVAQAATANFDNPDLQIGALKVYDNKVYVGMTCTAETTALTSNLRGFVFALDLDTEQFTQVVNVALNYPRDGGQFDPGVSNWNPWVPDESFTGGNVSRGSNPQPWLSDIEFDEAGFMVLGVSDRFGFQVGNNNNGAGITEGVAFGDILRLQPIAGSNWQLESNATSGGITTAHPNTDSGPCDGSNCGEYYWQEFYTLGDPYTNASHSEITVGGLAQWLGTGEVQVTVFDPAPVGGSVPLPTGGSATQSYRSGGIIALDHADGSRNRAYQYISLDMAGTFGKAASSGDIEILCDVAPLEIGNYVWEDTDLDGIQDPSEAPIPGVTVTLYDITGTLLASAVTDSNGEYYFIDETDPRLSTIFSVTVPGHVGVVPSASVVGGLLPETDYQIRIDTTQVTLENYKLTSANIDGGTTLPDAVDSDGMRNGDFAVIDLTTGLAGQNDHTFDFGFWPYVNVGNRVWYDTNNDNLDNDGAGNTPGSSTGVAGVTISLYYDTDGSGAWDGGETFITSTTTNGDGYYAFTELTPTMGADTAYIVVVDSTNFVGNGVLVDYHNSNANADDSPDPDADPTDQDDNGVGGGDVASKAITLVPGTEPTLGGDETSDAGNLPGIDANGNQTVDFGFYKLTVGDYVWEDYNNDGQVDSGEPPLVGLTVTLFDMDGGSPFFIDSTTTNGSGYYTFTDLYSSTYQIQVTPPSAAYVSSDGQTADDSSNDTDHGAPSGNVIVSQPFALTPGGGSGTNESATTTTGATENLNLDFGLWQPMSLGNRVWQDEGSGVGELNNGVDDSETGLAGVLLALLDKNDEPVFQNSQELTATTDASGYYTFTNLISGTYRVVVLGSNFDSGNALDGYVSSDDVASTAALDDNDNADDNGIGDTGSGDIESAQITLAYNNEPDGTPDVDGDTNDNTNLTLDFGFWRPLSIGNLVWRDLNNNGLYESGIGEVGIPGVTVTLAISGSASPILTTTTDINGNYSFTDLMPSEYIVAIPAANFAPGGALETLLSTVDPISASAINDDANDDDNGPGAVSAAVSSQPVLLAAGTEPNTDGDSSRNSNLTVDFSFVGLDFGDLPDGNATGSPDYRTLQSNGGPSHTMIPGLRIGAIEDIETDGQPTFFADGDNANGDDEEGIDLPAFVAGQSAVVTATVVNTTGTDAVLYGFIDFNGDGSFASGETVTQTVNSAASSQQVLLTFTVPADADYQQLLGARFRLSHDATLTADGVASNGEVEDYLIGVERYDLALIKRVGAVSESPLTPGSGIVTFTINVVNQGNMDATDIVVVDSVPTELTYQQADNPGWSALTPAAITIPGPLGESEIATVTLVLRVPLTAAGATITNTAEISAVSHIDNKPFIEVDSTPDSDPDNDGPLTDDELNNANGDEDDHDIAVISIRDSVAIGNLVWHDLNQDGDFDSAIDAPIQGVTVTLYLSGSVPGVDSPVATTVTGSAGRYIFDNLSPGDYFVHVGAENFQVGGVLVDYLSSIGVGNDETTDQTGDENGIDDADPATNGISTQIYNLTADGEPTSDDDTGYSGALDDNNVNLTADFAFILYGSIGDIVWYDADSSGGDYSTAGSEPGLPGVEVQLTDSNGATITATTSITGWYNFGNLLLGTYTVTVNTATLPYTVTTSPTFDPEADGNSLSVVTLTPADPVDLDRDFSYPPVLMSLGNLVWYDNNNDGLFDSGLGEAGIPGVTVTLALSGTASPILTTTTDVSGRYLFTGLMPNDYVVTIPAANFAPGGPLENLQSSTDPVSASSVNADNNDDDDGPGVVNGAVSSQPVNLAIGNEPTTDGDADNNSNLSVDFAFTQLGSIGDTVWYDLDSSGGDQSTQGSEVGLPGIEVQLTDSLAAVLTTTTDGSGNYLFADLPLGTYTVTVVTATLPTTVTTSATFDADGGNDSTSVVTINGTTPDKLDQDFSYPPVLGSIGDTVWYDMDSSGGNQGTQGAEPGLSGVEIQLTDSNGATVTTTTTITGWYLFDNLMLGTYTVTINTATLPVTVTTSPTFDADGGTDSLSVVTIDAGTPDNLDQDFSYPPVLMSLGDLVWYDNNNNGFFESGLGEAGIQGVTVTVALSGTASPLLTTTTAVDGSYLFTGLLPGDYVVTIPAANFAFGAPLENLQSSTDPASAAAINDDTNDDDDGPGVSGGVVSSQPVNLSIGLEPTNDGDTDNNSNRSVDFAFTQLGSIGDTVWYDADSSSDDQSNQGSEPGLPGVEVHLTDSLGGVLTTTTDSSGNYLFDNLPLGTYTVTVLTATLPNTVTTVATFDADGGNDSVSVVTIDAGTPDNLDQDFSYPPLFGSIGDTVWYDMDSSGGDQSTQGSETGLSGVEVQLTDSAGGVLTTTTDSNGTYLFDNLLLGGYTVTVNTASLPLTVTTDVTYDPDGGSDSASVVTLTPATPDDLNQDFSYPPLLGTIGDTIWRDEDRSGGDQGTQGSEPGLPGVEVQLTDGAGATITTTTDLTGTYLFTDLPLGVYTVTVNTATLPASVEITPTFDTDGGADSVIVTTLTPATPDDLDQDFSYPPLLGLIGDTIWYDLDSSGGDQSTQGSEVGLPGVEVQLTDSLGGILTTTTDSSGNYLFTGLPLGTYTVTVVTATLPVTVVNTPTYDADGGSDSLSVTTLTAVTPSDLDQDFSYPPVLGSIGDTVWYDIDSSGGDQSTQGSEAGLPGVEVQLTDSAGGVLTTTTDGSGNYLFDNLLLGEYTVTVNTASLPVTVTTSATYDPDGGSDSTSVVTLTPATPDNLNQDFSYPPLLGSIGDTIWYDINSSGGDQSTQGSEAGLPGVEVQLTDSLGGVLTTTTDSRGTYTFTNLPLGIYTVTVVTATLPVTVVATPSFDADGGSDSLSVVTIDTATPDNLEQDFSYPPVIQRDFGDLPFATLLGDDGARHTINPVANPIFGAIVDGEAEGAPSAAADGDDLADSDDEDGITIPPLVPGTVVTITIDYNNPVKRSAYINGWLDLNGDGTLDRILTSTLVLTGTAGTFDVPISVPANALPGTSYARFRISTEALLNLAGQAFDGEVEDYRVLIVGTPYDRGDLPDTGEGIGSGDYKTLVSNGGPSHAIVAGLYMGATVDQELDGQPTLLANGDDLNLTVDEDGVLFSTLAVNSSALVTVTATNTGTADALIAGWIDFNGDGDLNDSERITVSVPGGTMDGLFVLDFGIVPTNSVASTYARFRLSTDPAVIYNDGTVSDGEVEDYAVSIAVPPKYDFGDLPSGYPTLLVGEDGARHRVDVLNNPVLGITVDDEADGLPSTTADGDDLADSDDEDGVTIPTLVPDTTITVTVTYSNPQRVPVYIQGWLDFDGDGTLERIMTDTVAAPGSGTLTIPVAVPYNVQGGNAYARFRISSEATLGLGSQAPDGEVEDYVATILPLDYGDLPSGYPTLYSEDGARHLLPAVNPILGLTVDGETDGVLSVAADGDDLAGSADEDGVTIPALKAGERVTVTIAYSNPTGSNVYINGWFDLNGDGVLEQILTDEAVPFGSGTVDVSVTIPLTAMPGTTYGRFRISSMAGLTTSGLATDGEVEDYAATIAPILGSIGDTVWYDMDSSSDDQGNQGSESGLGGVDVALTDSSGSVISTTTTDSNGNYLFTNLPLGTYTVTVVTATLPVTVVTVPTFDADGSSDSLSVVTIDASSPDNVDQDFSYPPLRLSLGNYVWLDEDDSGTQNEDTSFGRDGITVTLTYPSGITETAVTANGGYYTFTNLAPNSRYTATFRLPPGYSFTTLLQGGDGALDSNPPTSGIVFVDLGVSDDFTIDVGIIPTHIKRVGLGDYVWIDINGNGIQDDPTDSAAAGLLVTLYDHNEVVTGTITTTADGYYSFTNLLEGLYRVEVEIPTGYTVTVGGADVDDDPSNSDSNGIAAGLVATSLPLTLTESSEPVGDNLSYGGNDAHANGTVDFGFRPILGSVGDTIWADLDSSGGDQSTQGSEPGLAGVEVQLSNSLGAIITTTTNVSGTYNFANLPLGLYTVTVNTATLPPTLQGVPTYDADGGSDSISVVTLTPAQPDNLAQDFSYPPIPPTATPTATATATDTPTDTPTATPTATATATATDTPTATPTATATATATDTPTATATATDTPTMTPTNTATATPTTTDTPTMTPTPTATATAVLLSLGNLVFTDRANNGLFDAGIDSGIDTVIVNLYRDVDGSGDLSSGDGTAIASVQTSGGGFYRFDNLPAGNYIVELAAVNFQPGGVLEPMVSSLASIFGGTDPRVDPDSNDLDNDDNGYESSSNGSRVILSQAVTLAPNSEPVTDGDSDANTNLTVDFGLFTGLALGNQVWIDANNNGFYDPGTGEVGLNGVTVNLYRDSDTNGIPDGAAIATTTTANDGLYVFEGLEADSYIVEILPPTGYTSSTGGNREPAPNADSDPTDLDDNGTTVGGPIQSGTVTLAVASEPTNEVEPNAINTTDLNGNLTVDFGLWQAVNVGNLVWHDRNNNGQVDAGEEGIANVPLQLFQEGDDPLTATPLATTVTDSNGNYNFGGLAPGRYFIYIPTPNPAYPWSDTNTDTADNREDNDDNGEQNNGIGTSVHSPVVELSVGGESTSDGDGASGDLTFDFGFFAPASLGDLVWLDVNRDGVQDAEETGWPDTPHKKGVPGVPVLLFTTDGVLVNTTTTDTSGYYHFADLLPGEYYVQFVIPNGYELTVADVAAATDIFDSDVAAGTLRTPVTVLLSGEHDPTLDMGLYLSGNLEPAAIGDFVWYDANHNGILDAGETGVPGVAVTLHRANDALVATTQTDATGFYEFNSLPPGDYYLTFTPPAGYQISPQNAGSDDSHDSDVNPANGRTESINLSPGEHDSSWDLGLYLDGQPAAIGNFVWFDANNNGMQDPSELGVPGVTVMIYRANGTLVATTVTNADGAYLFSNLAPGDYYLVFETPMGYVPTDADLGSDDALDSDVDVNTGRTPVTTLDGGESDLSWDYGVWYQVAGVDSPGVPAGVGDYVWYDTNNDGIQDSSEFPAAGITVILYNGLGELIAIDVTDSTGNYHFPSLIPGDYYVEFVTPYGYAISPVGSNLSDNTDSNADPSTGRTPIIPLLSGDDDPTWDSGFYRPPTAIEQGNEPQVNRIYLPVVSRLLIKLRQLRGEFVPVIQCQNGVCLTP